MSLALIKAGAVSAYKVPSESHIGFANAGGEVVAYLHKCLSYATFTPRAAVVPTHLAGRPTRHALERGGWDVFLSRNDRTANPPVTVAYGEPCPTCYILTPLTTGICDECNG